MKRGSNKKAAIEMSMTTIIVIVLGVVLLILGLVFVQFIFKKTTSLAEGAFEKAEGQIGDFSEVSKPLMITPDRIDLEKGESKIVVVVMANFKEEKANAKLKVTTKEATDNLACTFEDTSSTESDTYPIPSGEFRSVKLLVDSKETGTTGNKNCKVVATGLGEGIQDTVSIRIR